MLENFQTFQTSKFKDIAIWRKKSVGQIDPPPSPGSVTDKENPIFLYKPNIVCFQVVQSLQTCYTIKDAK